MAESQDSYPYDPEVIAALRASLSEPRFSTYLSKANGDEAFAFALYLYNARLAEAFLFPLGVSEITLRNAVDGVLVRRFGANWQVDAEFRDGMLTPESRGALNKAMDRAGSGDRGKLIAELTFDFWSNLFRVDYADFWRTHANIAFPGLVRGEGRREIQAIVKEINRLRNRVAHHEPILDMNAADLRAKMIRFVALRCPTTSNWMRHHSTISNVIRTRPNKSGSDSVTLASRADKRFVIVEKTTNLNNLAGDDVRRCSAFVCVENGRVAGAFTHRDIARYLLREALEAGGIFDLNDHTVGQLLCEPAIEEGWYLVPANQSFSALAELLKQSKTQIIIAVDPANNMPLGVVLRAHRRY